MDAKMMNAMKKPGAVASMMKAMGAEKKEVGMKPEFMAKAASVKGKFGQRARLAQTLKKARGGC